MDPLTLLNSVAITLGIIDKIADQIERFRKKQPEPSIPKPHSVLAEKRGEVIDFIESDIVQETITADDFTKLDLQSQQLIKALENSMQVQFNLWTQIYPQRDISPDPIVNAKVNTQLENIAQKMCDDMYKILDYLNEDMNKNLYDHYTHVRFICDKNSN